MVHLNKKEVAFFSELIPKRQFLVKAETRAKVLSVDLDRREFWEYTNSPYDNERRQAAMPSTDSNKS
jgi:hypothetical protein